MIDYGKIIIGEPTKCVVKIQPPTNFQREDIRIVGNTLSLIDANNNQLQAFEVSEIHGPQHPTTTVFDSVFRPYLSPFIQGFNVNFYAIGSSGSGQTTLLEGSRKEPGTSLLMMDALFNMLETQKYHTNTNRSTIQNYSYGIRVRFVEIIDEQIIDLIGKPVNALVDTLLVEQNAWQGPTIKNATWIPLTNAAQMNEVLMNGSKNRNNSSNQFGQIASQATSIFTIDLLQTSQLVDTRENLVVISRMNFIDLPGTEVLLEDPESIRIRQGSTMNKAILTLSSIIKELSTKRSDFVNYDNSTVSRLMKDALGGNSLSVGIYCIQNNDPKGSSLTLNFLKHGRQIQNFPVLNDQKAFGLLKKLRMETAALRYSKNQGQDLGGGGDEAFGVRGNIDAERQLIETNLDKLRAVEEKQRLAAKVSEIREKYNNLVKQKGELQNDLIRSEQEKLEVSKALVELQIENTRLMEIIQNEKYDFNNKLLNAEGDIMNLNSREEKALRQLQQCQEKMRELFDEQRELEMEFISLKQNYLQQNNLLDQEKLKNQNIGMELINIVNENQALHDEMNDIYKKTGATTEENSRFINRMEKLEQENQEQRQALVFAKAEIERLKTEMLQYDIMDQQHRIDVDNQRIQMERGYMDMNKDKQSEFLQLNREAENSMKKIQQQRMMWESQKMELVQKNKIASRQIAEYEDKFSELAQQNQELTIDNNQQLLQLDEMRSIYRNQLIQFTSDQSKLNGDKPMRVGYDMNAREELIRTYTQKEIELTDQLDQEKRMTRNLQMEILALQNYSRNIKYLAEDWAPVGVPLPDILTKDPPVRVDEDNGAPERGSGEAERLRQRNRKLEEQVRILQEQVMSQNQNAMNDPNIQQRLLNEIDMLKGKPDSLYRPGSSSGDTQSLRRERNDLQEENRRLVTMLKDNKQWDIYLLQKDNERLMKAVKNNEHGSDNVGPISGDSNSLKQRVPINNKNYQISYYEQMIQTLEKERSQLMVRATMAEEQLKSLQEHLSKTTLDYQKQILEAQKAKRI